MVEFTNIKKFGNSYYILLPKKLYDFYNWDENTLISIDFTSESIIIKKIGQTDDEYKRRAGIEVEDDKDRAVEKIN